MMTEPISLEIVDEVEALCEADDFGGAMHHMWDYYREFIAAAYAYHTEKAEVERLWEENNTRKVENYALRQAIAQLRETLAGSIMVADRIERIASDIPAPNTYTPRIMMECDGWKSHIRSVMDATSHLAQKEPQ